MEKICKVQRLMFDLIRLASFNDFDGQMVVQNLTEHRDLWLGCIMDGNDLIKLRDISDNLWNADTLYIITTGVDDEKLERMATDLWCANEVIYLNKDEAEHRLGTYPCEYKVLKIWWD